KCPLRWFSVGRSRSFVAGLPPRYGSETTLMGPLTPSLVPRYGSETQIPGDEHLHDLVRAGPDLRHAGVAPGAGHAVLVHVAVAAVDLDAVVEHLALDLRAPPLRLGGVNGGELLAGVLHDALVDVGLGDLDAGDQVSQQELGVLERSDRHTEG